ncbi:MAG: hypothetical protein KAX78_02020, partial [Phycisphaerae bacterium]|nr:hypothetical protein [Phycisphaerae bacterium]
QLEAERRTEEAKAVREAPVIAPAVVVPDSLPKSKGVTYRTKWKARIDDVSQIPRAYMEPNIKAIDAYARTAKSAAMMPGVTFYSIEEVAASGLDRS